MKRIFIFAVTTLAVLLLTACGGQKSSDELIVGTWAAVAPMVISESGMQITFSDITSTYNENHTSSSSGKMTMSGDLLPQNIDMVVLVKSTWSIDGDKITETITDADIQTDTVISGAPNLGETMRQQMIAEGAKTSTIVTLDKKTLVLAETETNIEITMKRQ